MEYYWLESSGSGWALAEGSCELGKEYLGSINCCEIREQLGDWRLLKKDSQLPPSQVY
jgi:hypothetical protein